MKLPLLVILLASLTIGMLYAQGRVGGGTHRNSPFQSYAPNTRPPLLLPEAYALAIAHVRDASNQFYCVSANCLELTNAGFTGWTFSFSNTNGQLGRVDVYFDREVVTVARDGEVLIGK